MAKIDLSKVLEHVDRELAQVLRETIDGLGVEAKIDKEKLFRLFRDRIRLHFRYPVEIPDQYVEVKEK